MEILLQSRKVLITCMVIVAGAAFVGVLGYQASAAEPVPGPVTNATETLEDNQTYIEEHRPIVNEWNARKTDNAVQIGIMRAHCYEYDFAKKKPAKIKDCTPSFQ